MVPPHYAGENCGKWDDSITMVFYAITADDVRPRTRKNATSGTAKAVSGHRYFHPGIGRWTSRDPIGESGFRAVRAQINHKVHVSRERNVLAYLKLMDESRHAADAGLGDVAHILREMADDLPRPHALSVPDIGIDGAAVSSYAFVDNSTINNVDIVGLHGGDKRYGYPDRFWRWYHRNRKGPGDPDLDKEGADEAYREWQDLGEPGADGDDYKVERRFVCPPLPAPNPIIITDTGLVLIIIFFLLAPVGV